LFSKGRPYNDLCVAREKGFSIEGNLTKYRCAAPHKPARRVPPLPFAGQGVRGRLFGREQQKPDRMEPSKSLELYRRRTMGHPGFEGPRAVDGIRRQYGRPMWRT